MWRILKHNIALYFYSFDDITNLYMTIILSNFFAKEPQIPNGMPSHPQCLPNGIPPTTGPGSCGPLNGSNSILNNQPLGPGGISTHPGHINGLGGPGGSLSNGPNSGGPPPHLPIPTPPIHTSNPNSLPPLGQNGPPTLPSSMIGGPNSSNNGIGLPPLPSMSSGKFKLKPKMIFVNSIK